MRSLGSGLGLRLTIVTYLVVMVFITVGGYTVYRFSQDSIKTGAMTMVRDITEKLLLEPASDKSVEELGDTVVMVKINKTGSVWIMDEKGFMRYNPDPRFREEYVANKKNFGNVVVHLQHAEPRLPGQGVFKEKLIDIIDKYEEGFGTYSQFGEKRILAFKALPGRGLLIGVDEPVTSANSELERIRKYIIYTALISAVLIMLFNFLSIRIIIRPYYQEVEDLNTSLQRSNVQLEDLNTRLASSNKNLTALHEIGLAMQQSLTLKDILEIIISGAHDVLNIDRINLMLPNADGSFLECRAAIGNEDEPIENIRVPTGGQGGSLAAAFERKEVIRFGEGVKLPLSLKLPKPYSEIRFLRSPNFVVVPLVVKDQAVGIIGLDNKTSRRPITEAQVNLMSIFANQAAVAVENAHLYDELRRKISDLDAKVDQLSILHQIGNSMQRVTDRSEALGFIMRGIREGMGFGEVLLCLMNREEDVLQGEVGIGVPEEDVKTIQVPLFEEENLLVMSASGKRPVGIVHFKEDSLVEIVKSPLHRGDFREVMNVAVSESLVALVAVPLVAREEVVGVVLVSRREPPVIKRTDVELLMLYANTAGLTVERAELYGKMYQDLESLEITDHVSRLFTYRYGQQRVQETIDNCKEAGQPLAVILMGIDNFKEYNETCGLDIGNRALSEIGEIVKTGIRGSDFAYRYGGRLMVAVLPGTTADTATEIAEGIQSRIRRHRFRGAGGDPDQILTLSIGVMEKKVEDDIQSEEDLFKLLLALLHRVEAEGGDRILTG